MGQGSKMEEVVEEVVADMTSSLVTENVVGSVAIPSSPPISVSMPYIMLLCAFIGILLVTDRIIHNKAPAVIVTREFKTFQKSYVHVYLLALGTEWLQDSYLLALLLRRGYAIEQVASLFLTSFGVTFFWEQLGLRFLNRDSDFVGGKRSMCICCFSLYVLSAVSVFHDEYSSIFIGRLFYGTATALLHTSFDAWMNGEHMHHAFPDEWLMQTYQEVARKTVFVAVGSGVLAEVCASYAGLAAPFLASSACALIGISLISRSWPKSAGTSLNCDALMCDGGLLGAMVGSGHSFVNSLVELLSSASGKIAIHVVAVQSFFETSMYIILFMWTPTLNASTIESLGIGIPPPYGLVFSILMAALMLGSHTFQLALSSRPPEKVCQFMCCIAAMSALVMALCGTSGHWVIIGALVMFQFCVGIYYPVIGHIRGQHIPYEHRSAVSDSAKLLLAIFVVVILLNFSSMAAFVFLTCAVMLGGGAVSVYAADFVIDDDDDDDDDEYDN